MDRYQVSVAVLTYKPNREKLLETLRSVLAQKDVLMQIVIADDGSEQPEFEAAKALFAAEGFTDFVLVENKVNRGTVCNVQSAVDRCEGKYVKLISPGDLLLGDSTLSRWADTMVASDADLSFCEAVYYTRENGELRTFRHKTSPQVISCYQNGRIKTCRYNYLLANDFILGAATMCRRAVMKQYIDEIAGKVRYAEDNIYRLMICDGTGAQYFPENAVLYETASGVSTSGNTFWQQKLREDFDAATAMLLSRRCPDGKFSKKLQRFYRLPSGAKGKLLKYLLFPKLFFLNGKKRFFPRKSSDYMR